MENRQCGGERIMKILLLPLCFIMLGLAGCSDEPSAKITTDDLEEITLKLVDQKEEEDGMRYTVELVNGSEFVLKQNTIFLSYPIKVKNGFKGNSFKVEGEGNKLDIEPDEEVTIEFFAPNEGLNESKLSMEVPDIQMKGYLEKVDGDHFFSKGGSLD